MDIIEIANFGDLNNLTSNGGKYMLKVCETYMYIQNDFEGRIEVEVSLDTDRDTMNKVLSIFGFPYFKILSEREMLLKRVEELERILIEKESQITRMRDYINKLENNNDITFRIEQAIDKYERNMVYV